MHGHKHTPSTRRPSGDLRFKLNRQAQETVEPIKGDMRNMAHVSWGTNVHNNGADVSARKLEGFPEKGQKKSQERSEEKGIIVRRE